MVLNAHADSVDKNGDHDAPAEVFALHDAPEFSPHAGPDVSQVAEACPLPPMSPALLLFLVQFLHCILLLVPPIGAVPHSPAPFRPCTYGAVVGALRHGQADGAGRRLGAVLGPALVRAVGRCTHAETSLAFTVQSLSRRSFSKAFLNPAAKPSLVAKCPELKSNIYKSVESAVLEKATIFATKAVFLAVRSEGVLTSRVPKLMTLSVGVAPTVSGTPAPPSRRGLASQRVVERR